MAIDSNYIVQGLVRRGIPQHIAQGFAANFHVESGYNPTAVGDGGHAYGLAQWNDRRPALYDFAALRGQDASDPELQLDFVMHELQTTEAGAWDRISQAQNAEEAARLISDHYERPGTPHMDRRLEAARSISGGTSLSGSGAPIQIGSPDERQERSAASEWAENEWNTQGRDPSPTAEPPTRLERVTNTLGALSQNMEENQGQEMEQPSAPPVRPTSGHQPLMMGQGALDAAKEERQDIRSSFWDSAVRATAPFRERAQEFREQGSIGDQIMEATEPYRNRAAQHREAMPNIGNALLEDTHALRQKAQDFRNPPNNGNGVGERLRQSAANFSDSAIADEQYPLGLGGSTRPQARPSPGRPQARPDDLVMGPQARPLAPPGVTQGPQARPAAPGRPEARPTYAPEAALSPQARPMPATTGNMVRPEGPAAGMPQASNPYMPQEIMDRTMGKRSIVGDGPNYDSPYWQGQPQAPGRPQARPANTDTGTPLSPTDPNLLPPPALQSASTSSESSQTRPQARPDGLASDNRTEEPKGFWGRIASGWENMQDRLGPDRRDFLLAMGQGLLSGDDWQSGLAAGGANLLAMREADTNQEDALARIREQARLDTEQAQQGAAARSEMVGNVAFTDAQGNPTDEQTAQLVFRDGKYYYPDGREETRPFVKITSSNAGGDREILTASDAMDAGNELVTMANTLQNYDTTIGLVTDLAADGNFGAQGVYTGITAYWQSLIGKGYTPEQLTQAAAQGMLQGMVGASRESVVGGGPMTEQDAARVIEAIGGDLQAYGDNPDAILYALQRYRDQKLNEYNQRYDQLTSFSGNQPGNPYIIPQRYTGTDYQTPVPASQQGQANGSARAVPADIEEIIKRNQ